MSMRRARVRTLRTVGAGAAALLLITGTGASAAPPRSLEWRLTGCDGVVALVPSTPQALQPHLPAGFTAFVPPAVAAALPPDPRLRAVVGLEVFDCAEGSGLRGSVGRQQYASVFTFVQPPAHLRNKGFDLDFFKWETLVPDTPRREALAAAGLPVEDGSVALDLASARTSSASPVYAVDATWRTASGGRHRFTGAAAAPTTFAGTFVEYQRATGGLAEWQSRYGAPAANGGGGRVELAPGSLPARILGAQSSDAYLLVPSQVDFRGRTVLPRGGRR
jgi:hypothetical protein